MDPLSILTTLFSLGTSGFKEQPQIKPSSPPPQIPQGILGVLDQPLSRFSLADTSLPGAPEASASKEPSLGATEQGIGLQKSIQEGLNKKTTPKIPGLSPEGRDGVRAANDPSKGSFLGLDSQQWNSIGTATSILAKLFEQRPQQQGPQPSMSVPQIASSSLGAGLTSNPHSLNLVQGSAPSFPTQELAKIMRRS